jgi:hypothetical protein
MNYLTTILGVIGFFTYVYVAYWAICSLIKIVKAILLQVRK